MPKRSRKKNRGGKRTWGTGPPCRRSVRPSMTWTAHARRCGSQRASSSAHTRRRLAGATTSRGHSSCSQDFKLSDPGCDGSCIVHACSAGLERHLSQPKWAYTCDAHFPFDVRFPCGTLALNPACHVFARIGRRVARTSSVHR